MRSVGTGIVLVVGMALYAGQANAQEEEAAEGGEAELQQSLDAEARALYQAGAVAYADGRYEAAERHFRGAYEASDRPQLLYNIALSAERARDDQAALEAYELFLERVPDAEQRFRAETRIAALREILQAAANEEPEADVGPAEEPEPDPAAETAQEEPPTDAEPESEPPSDAEPSGSSSILVPALVIGGSAAVAVAGAILLGVGLADVAAVEGAQRPAMWSDVSDANDRAPILTGVGIALLAVGLAGATLGVVLAVTGGGNEDASARLRIGPGSVHVEGSF